MDNNEQKRGVKDWLTKWLKNKYNLAFLGVLVFTIALRIYYFAMTKSQPVWWDEAEYLNMARAIAFNQPYEFLAVRPILFSLITAFFFLINNSEFLPRIFMLLISVFSVAGMYYLGKEIYNEKVGLISAFFMSVFYLNIFFSMRLLVDVVSLSFFIFSALFFYKYLTIKKSSFLYFSAIIIGVGTLFKINTALILIPFLIYLVITEKHLFLKKKEIWIALGIFSLILAPYIIWGFFQFNGFVFTQAAAWNAPQGDFFSAGLNVMKNYLVLFPGYLSIPLLAVFLIGLLLYYKIFIGADILLKGKNPELKKQLFLLLILIIPFVITSFSLHNEDRYILNTFPALFIIASTFLLLIYQKIKKYNKFLAIILVAGLILYAGFYQIKATDSLTKNKIPSYKEIRQAGLWIKENSNKTDAILTSSPPHVQYYGEREVISFPETEEEMENLTHEKNPKYMMISIYEKSPEWVYNYSQTNGIAVAKVFYISDQPAVIIYRMQ